MIFFLNVESKNRTEVINITDEIREIIEDNKIKNGLLNIYILLTLLPQ
jgi:thiamine phosphate synthase YjbQ (UPF0047 family)